MKLTMNVIFTERELAPLETYKTFHSPKKHLSFLENTPKNDKSKKERKLVLMNQWIHQYQSQQAQEKKERKDKVQLIQMLM